jgi:hypothetical protein
MGQNRSHWAPLLRTPSASAGPYERLPPRQWEGVDGKWVDGDVEDGDPARRRHEDVATGPIAEGGAIGSDARAVGEAWEAAGGVSRGLMRCPPCARPGAKSLSGYHGAA